jgi:hypothetical protein
MALAVGQVRLTKLRFPGRAGELQSRNAVPAFVRELGDNYVLYHGFLAEALEHLGGVPDRAAFDDGDAFMEAYEQAHEIVMAEALLRNCRAFRTSGRPLDSAADPRTPLVDSSGRLVDEDARR